MNYEFYNTKDGKFLRINKTEAKKLFEKGEFIYLLPINGSLGAWLNFCEVKKNDETFESVVREYEYYNCVKELGKTAKFFKLLW